MTPKNKSPFKNNKKNVVRLTESDLHQIVKESVTKILKEADYAFGNEPEQEYEMPLSNAEKAFKEFINSTRKTPNDCFSAGVDYNLWKKFNWNRMHSYANSNGEKINDPTPLENELKKQFIRNYERLQKQGWIVNEGQGQNAFKSIANNKGNYDANFNDPEYLDAKRKFIKYGDEEYDETASEHRPYYDNHGMATYLPTSLDKEIPNKKIKRGYLGQLGRWAGINAGQKYVQARRGLNRAKQSMRNTYDKVFG